MPKAAKTKAAGTAKLKTEPIESINHLPIEYQPIAPVHFTELYNIWENDRRIPTVASRTAWSLARNLNPLKVNRWWYRRKVVAKKFKIRIPGDSYELDVGIPPLVVVKLPTLVHAPDSDPALPNSGSSDTLVDLPSSTCASFVVSNRHSSEYTDTPLKDAYIHDTKDSKDVIVASDRTVDVSTPAFCDSSPLPPSSPNIRPFSSLSPISPIASFEADPDILEESTTPGSDCTLVLSTPTDDWKRIDLGIKNDLITYLYVVAKAYAPAAELDGPFEETSLLLTPFQPCQWSEAFLSFYTFPTWCFAGFRTAYDGSIVCDCLCSTRLESCSGETPDGHLNASRLTDGLGDGFPAAFNP